MSLSHTDPTDNKDSITASTQSRSIIDPDLLSEPDLKRDSSVPAHARTQSLTENKRYATLRQRNSEGKVIYDRSESINGDDGSPRLVSEPERDRYDTQAGSLAVNPSSTVTGPGDSEVLDPAILFNSRSRLEKRLGDVDSGPGSSSNTGPTVTESDVLEKQENRHSPTAAATAEPTTREAPRARHSPTAAATTAEPTTREAPRARHSPTAAATTAEPTTREAPRARHSPTAAATAEPTTREAPRARQARKTYRWAILCFGGIFGLIVTALTLSDATGYKSLSVELRKLCGPICRAGVGVISAYLWGAYHATQQAYHATQQVYSRLPIMGPVLRHSSGEVLGAGLGDIYSNLSQALAAGNSLHPIPSLISQKRRQAMRFRLPGWSFTKAPLGLFLQQSVHIDEDLLKLMLSLGTTAGSALRQQQLTNDTLRSIQHVEDLRIIQPLRIVLFGTSTQESQLQTRLAHHLFWLNRAITDTDQKLRKVLGDFVTLAHTTETIRNGSIQDRERCLGMKEEDASQRFWVFRASIYVLGVSEPEHLAEISQNIELADDIYEWAQDIVVLLDRATLYLQCAKTIVGSLIGTLHEFGTVKWNVADKDHKIQEFLALIGEGQQLLTYNHAAWYQLLYGGHFT